jgi:fumarate hydratase class II
LSFFSIFCINAGKQRLKILFLERMMMFRIESDSMGAVRIPESAYYGPQTQRAKENFPISGRTLPQGLIQALSLIKGHAAAVNRDLGLLDGAVADAVIQAVGEVRNNRLGDQFVVDVFQTGSGTSTNMNMNEVLASRSNEILTGTKGGRSPVHPNDHVNLGQSSNDLIPSALHIATALAIRQDLVPGLQALQEALSRKARDFAGIRKIGRTHLQDALPVTLGQEFSGYARQVELGVGRVERALADLYELALGGTAVGTGVNVHPRFAGEVISRIKAETGLPFCEAENHFEAQGAQDAAVAASGALKTVAASLMKIANDIRWMASGPRCGLGEINLPPLQPGSSIMPGKVNPVICESVIQVGMQVMGNDTAVTLGGTGGVFELNLALPVIADNLLASLSLLSTASRVFAEKCIDGITANADVCSANIEKSLALATLLVPHIGYDRAAALAKQAHDSGKTIRETAMEAGLLPEEELNRLLEEEPSV